MQTNTYKPTPVNTLPELRQSVWSLEHLHGLVMAEVFQHLAGALHGGEMTFSQLNALFRLYNTGPQTVAAVAKGADLSPAAASRMVERLVQAGLVERREDTVDRRQKRIEVTAEGIARLRTLQRVTADTYRSLLSEAPEEKLKDLATALAAMRPLLPSHPLPLDNED